jgi:hypothetical protein
MSTRKGFGFRIAVICIDNAVELMIKTYLGLPKRVSNIQGLSRKALSEMSESFPALLDGLETYAPEKLTGIELGEIEWFHRVRNNLYHDGNGITVERRTVEGYGAIARILFRNLFEEEVQFDSVSARSPVGDILEQWVKIERELQRLSGVSGREASPTRTTINAMQHEGKLDEETIERLDVLRRLRNQVAHAVPVDEDDIKSGIRSARKLLETLRAIK